jgi:hypothetical protein
VRLPSAWLSILNLLERNYIAARPSQISTTTHGCWQVGCLKSGLASARLAYPCSTMPCIESEMRRERMFGDWSDMCVVYKLPYKPCGRKMTTCQCSRVAMTVADNIITQANLSAAQSDIQELLISVAWHLWARTYSGGQDVCSTAQRREREREREKADARRRGGGGGCLGRIALCRARVLLALTRRRQRRVAGGSDSEVWVGYHPKSWFATSHALTKAQLRQTHPEVSYGPLSMAKGSADGKSAVRAQALGRIFPTNCRWRLILLPEMRIWRRVSGWKGWSQSGSEGCGQETFAMITTAR